MKKYTIYYILLIFIFSWDSLNADTISLGEIVAATKSAEEPEGVSDYKIELQYDTSRLTFLLILTGTNEEIIYSSLLGARLPDMSYDINPITSLLTKFDEWSEVALSNNVNDFSKQIMTLTTKTQWFADSRWQASYQSYLNIEVIYHVVGGIAFIELVIPELIPIKKNKKALTIAPSIYIYKDGIANLKEISTAENIQTVLDEKKVKEDLNNLFQ